MIWREEQRAIGELMRIDGEQPRCISFDSFVKQYEERFAPWFGTFAAELDSTWTPTSERLAQLQQLLVGLVNELDVDRIVVRVDRDGEHVEPRWTRPSMLAATARTPLINPGTTHSP